MGTREDEVRSEIREPAQGVEQRPGGAGWEVGVHPYCVKPRGGGRGKGSSHWDWAARGLGLSSHIACWLSVDHMLFAGTLIGLSD